MMQVPQIDDSTKAELRATIAKIEAETPEWAVNEANRIAVETGSGQAVIDHMMRHVLRRTAILQIARQLLVERE